MHPKSLRPRAIKNIFDISGKVAVVTGGNRGLGYAMAKGLTEAGVKVAVVTRGKERNGVQALNVGGAEACSSYTCDLGDPENRKGLLDRILSDFGAIDILVNNAGHQFSSAAIEYPIEYWRQDIEVMLTAVLDLSQQAAKYMSVSGGGKIINIASISGFQGAKNIIGYSTVKHALIGLTKCLANEWAQHGINVNGIAPGIFETEMAEQVFRDRTKYTEMVGRVPSGRFGKPVDLVGPLIFLCSDASSHVHGHTLVVDGGWLGR
jgi:2-deoxy-D-gluconate 3-dehydrogenase